jgi:hypothetical protein
MKKLTKLVALALFGAITLAGGAQAVPFLQCPGISAFSTSCAVLITINADSSVMTQFDGSQGPYDGEEDSLVGVQNNSSATISFLTLTGFNIFGFDDDGQQAFTGNSFGPTGYEGPQTSFTVVNNNTGNVNFTGGLAAGGSRWFTLEEAPIANGFVVTPR